MRRRPVDWQVGLDDAQLFKPRSIVFGHQRKGNTQPMSPSICVHQSFVICVDCCSPAQGDAPFAHLKYLFISECCQYRQHRLVFVPVAKVIAALAFLICVCVCCCCILFYFCPSHSAASPYPSAVWWLEKIHSTPQPLLSSWHGSSVQSHRFDGRRTRPTTWTICGILLMSISQSMS
jgi:hypothetical protein